jgi:hypothetical protein
LWSKSTERTSLLLSCRIKNSNWEAARQVDVVKLGFTVDLSAAPPPPAEPRYVKALPPK